MNSLAEAAAGISPWAAAIVVRTIKEHRERRRLLGEAAPARPASGGLLTAQEAAEYVGCHPNTIYAAARSGALSARRAGRLVRFAPADLDAWTGATR